MLKRLFIMVLPLMVLIALVFKIMNKEYTFNGFIQVISTLRFNNAFTTFSEINVTWGNLISNINSIGDTNNILLEINKIVKLMGDMLNIIVLTSRSIFDIIHDLFVNLEGIFTYLFVN